MSAPPQTTIAIVIPVLDEAHTIEPLLEDCRSQIPAPDEVVVVDAGSRDGTTAIVDRVAEGWSAVRLVHAPGATPGAGRNAGVRAARSEVLVTIDAGSRVAPDWLAALSAPVVREQHVLAVGVAVPDARSSFERAAGWFTLRAFKPPDRPGPVGGSFLPAGRNGFCFRREAWAAAGGYPEALPWGEDKRFLGAMRASGVAVHVVPHAEVRWRPRESPRALFVQYFRYGRGDARARIDRQNELVPLGLFAIGGALAARAARGDRRAAATLLAGTSAYLGVFTRAALRDLEDPRDAAWVPLMRLLVDVAKVSGYVVESLRGKPDR